jgi:hypothetical protein
VPIASTDIVWTYSVKTGSAGNSTAGTAAGSLGKYISTTAITNNVANNVFDDISGDENAASTVDYRALFVKNAHGSLTLTAPKVWISAEVAGGASVAIAIDNLAASAIGSSSAQAAEIANETTAPTGVGAFSSPTTKAAGLSLADLPSGQCRAVWWRRTAANSAAINADGVTVTVEGDTAA